MTELNRRNVIVGGIAASAALLATTEAKADHHGAHKGGNKRAAPTKAEQAVIKSTAECLAAGRVCLAACTDHLAAGMKNMASCQKAVMNMLAVCEAMAEVAAYRTASAKDVNALAATCAQFCKTCEDACRAHAKHHVECKNCMNACQDCREACEALAK